jgi:hypothetical protein
MMGMTAGWWALAGAGTAALHAVTWPYSVAVLAVTALYRLSAERERRKTLIDLVTSAPANTVVIMDKGPGGPAVWVRVGDGGSPPMRREVLRGR